MRRQFCLMIVVAVSCAAPLFAAEGQFQRTLSVNGSVNVELTTGSGSIQVHTGGSNQVQITGHIKATDWFSSGSEERIKRIEDNPPIQQSGNSIRVGHLEDPELRRNISISYELVVPADTQMRSETGSGNQTIDGIHGMLEAEAGSGGLRISNIGSAVRANTGSGNIEIDHVQGSVRAKAGSGSIRATEIAGAFEADTGSGRVTLEQTAPGTVRVGTGSGGMELHGVRGSLEAHAGSGGIRADGDPTGSWLLRTGSGTVEVKVPSNAAFDLNAHTSSGSISVNHPVTVEGAMGRKEIHGKVRGGGVPVEVTTGSGNIEIE